MWERKAMVQIEIGKNEQDQRLDRFLKKYLRNASLSHIYKMIRKDVKVNGKRAPKEQMLREGDILSLYLPDTELEKLRESRKPVRAKRSFRIVYEDEKILIVSKPKGLLTHGDSREKKEHLANQVLSYLIEKGEFDPASTGTFQPSPVNRLDRNTSGLVLFGKDYEALKYFNARIRQRDGIRKFYLTILAGEPKEELVLTGHMVRDEAHNRSILTEDPSEAREMKTVVTPLVSRNGFTLCQVEIDTGRTHQIRLQTAGAGFSVLGDPKYGDPARNAAAEKLGITSQLLHAFRLEFGELDEAFGKLSGRAVTDRLPAYFEKSIAALFGEDAKDLPLLHPGIREK